jgi:hypothetical protein
MGRIPNTLIHVFLVIFFQFIFCSVNNVQLLYFNSNYQDLFTLILLFSPEVILSFLDYFYYYYGTFYSSSLVPAACFDSYVNNLNYNFNEGIIFFFLFFFFSWFIVYFFYMNFILKWSKFNWTQLVRAYFYSFSISKDTRVQYEALIQTAIFLFFIEL